MDYTHIAVNSSPTNSSEMLCIGSITAGDITEVVLVMSQDTSSAAGYITGNAGDVTEWWQCCWWCHMMWWWLYWWCHQWKWQRTKTNWAPFTRDGCDGKGMHSNHKQDPLHLLIWQLYEMAAVCYLPPRIWCELFPCCSQACCSLHYTLQTRWM